MAFGRGFFSRKRAPQISFLDAYQTNCTCAFSFSKIFSTSTLCMRLRRSSDNAEQDFSFTTSHVLDSAAITTWLGGSNGYMVKWYNQTGSGKDLVQATASSQPLFILSSLNGKPELQFDGTDDSLNTTSSPFTTAENTSFTETSLIRSQGNGKYPIVIGAYNLFTRRTTTTATILEAGGIMAQNYFSNVNDANLYNCVYDGVKSHGYLNNLRFSVSKTNSLGLNGQQLKIGGFSSFYSDGKCALVMFWKVPLTQSEINSVNQKFSFDYQINTNTKRYLLFGGDSITYGTGASTTNAYPGLNYPSRTIANFGGTGLNDFVNQGAPGAPVGSENINSLTGLNGFRKCIAFIWAGTNDIYLSSRTGANTHTDLAARCLFWKNAGFKVITFTCMPRYDTSGTAAAKETERQNYNTLIRANWSTYADQMVDVDADPYLATMADLGSTYTSDRTHPSDAGYAVIASLVVPKLQLVY